MGVPDRFTEFAWLVGEMRAAQRQYDKGRTKERRAEMIRLQNEVDRVISLLGPKTDQNKPGER